MDKWEAQHDFWNSFGVPAYEEHSVPDDAPFPRITYQASSSVFESPVPITASVWTKSTSWAQADSIADLIELYILNQGRSIQMPKGEGTITVNIPVCKPIDNGYMRIFIGDTTFAQKMDDPNDNQIKRTILNVNFEFMSNR